MYLIFPDHPPDLKIIRGLILPTRGADDNILTYRPTQAQSVRTWCGGRSVVGTWMPFIAASENVVSSHSG